MIVLFFTNLNLLGSNMIRRNPQALSQLNQAQNLSPSEIIQKQYICEHHRALHKEINQIKRAMTCDKIGENVGILIGSFGISMIAMFLSLPTEPSLAWFLVFFIITFCYLKSNDPGRRLLHIQHVDYPFTYDLLLLTRMRPLFGEYGEYSQGITINYIEFIEKTIQDYEKTLTLFAFFSGTHPRIGNNSPVYQHFRKNTLYDANLRRLLLSFVEKDEKSEESEKRSRENEQRTYK